MFCTNCGKEIPTDALFCPYCGTKSIQENAAELAEKAVEDASNAAEGVKEAAVIEAAAVAQAAELDAEAKAAEAVQAFDDAAAQVADAAGDAAEAAEQAADGAIQAADQAADGAIQAADQAADGAIQAAEAGAAALAADAVAQTAEAADQAAEAVQDAADAPADAVPEEQPKKKSKLPIILAIVLVIAGVAGYFIYSNLPATKTGKLLKQAEAFIAEQKYTEALESVAAAKELTPDNVAVFNMYDKIFEEESKPYIDENGFPNGLKAIDIYVEASNTVPEYKDNYINTAAELLKKMATKLATDTDPESLRSYAAVYKDYSDKKGVPGLASIITSFESQADKLETELVFKKFAQSLKEHADKEDYSFMVSTVLVNMLTVSEFYQKVIKPAGTISSNFPLICSIDGTDKKVGVYYRSGGYQIYYGTYGPNNRRVGEGVWIPIINGGIGNTYSYCYVGEWDYDKPNGKVTAHVHTKTATAENQYVLETTAKNGLFDGDAKYTFSSGDTFDAKYVSGVPQVIATDNGQDIYGYNQDHSRKLVNLRNPDGVLYCY